MIVDFTKAIEKCSLCERVLKAPLYQGREVFEYQCDACGNVLITRDVVREFRGELDHKRYLLSGISRERTELNLPTLKIDEINVHEILISSNVPRNISQKLDKILLHLERESDYAGKPTRLPPQISFPIAFAKNINEFKFFLRQLDLRRWLNLDPDGEHVVLTLEGWNQIDEIQRLRKPTNQVFIAMWFSDETKSAYENGLSKAVAECGFDPLRIDLIQFNERIDDRIIAEIRKSAFLVADFTKHRGGVYFEAGFAMGLGIPVIWTCRKDYITSAHFDTRQYNHIVWENETELYQKLKDRIEASIVK